MDACSSNEPPRAATPQQKQFSAMDSARPPLVTTEKNNAVLANVKLRTREVASRYKPGITAAPPFTETAPRRFPSPNARHTSPAPGMSLPKRSLSVESRRPSSPSARTSTPSAPSSRPSSPSLRIYVPSPASLRFSSVPSSPTSRHSTPSSPPTRPTTPVRDSMGETHNSSRRLLGSRDGLWPSMRSLSSSFQSESSSLLTSRRDRMVRNCSPDPMLKSAANVASERKRTPVRGRDISEKSENSKPSENSHAKMIDQHRWPSMGKVPMHAFSKSTDLTVKVNRSASLPVPTLGLSPTRRMLLVDSVPSLQRTTNETSRRSSSEGIKMLETSAGVNLPSHPSERASRTLSLPLSGLHRPSSPNKALSVSTYRGIKSPSRTRPSTPVSACSSTASRVGFSTSVFNYIIDGLTGKKSPNYTEDAHLLRLLYNRGLQWCFANAQADSAFVNQTITAENTLYSVWSTTSDLRDSVSMRKINLQKLKQEMILNQVLNEQLAYLEEWTSLEKEHSICLHELVEVLRQSTLRLPVARGTRADVRAIQKAVNSAVDIMQAMGSSVCYLLSRVENTSHAISELSSVAAKERAMLNECRELLASAAAMQVQECSLRAHLLQLRQDGV